MRERVGGHGMVPQDPFQGSGFDDPPLSRKALGLCCAVLVPTCFWDRLRRNSSEDPPLSGNAHSIPILYRSAHETS